MFEQIVERGFDGNFSNGENSLEHLKANERFEEFFVSEIDGNVFGALGEELLKFGQASFGEDDGFDEERTFEQALDDFIAFGHENALRSVFGGAAQGAVGREFGRVEGGDGLDTEHAKILDHR